MPKTMNAAFYTLLAHLLHISRKLKKLFPGRRWDPWKLRGTICWPTQ